MFEAAIGTYIAIMLLCLYIGLKRVAGYAWLFDAIVFAGCCWMFIGTYAGMMTGIIAGVFFSLTMHIIRKVFGFQQLKLRRKHGQWVPRLNWEDIKPCKLN